MPEKTLIEKLAELLEVDIVPPLDGGEAQALHKALPGYQAVADDAARFVQKHGGTLNLDASVLADLEAGLVEVLRLEPADHALEKLHQSVYHQRLRATDRCMEGLYDTTRRILKLRRRVSSFLILCGPLSLAGGRRRTGMEVAGSRKGKICRCARGAAAAEGACFLSSRWVVL